MYREEPDSVVFYSGVQRDCIMKSCKAYKGYIRQINLILGFNRGCIGGYIGIV